PFLIEFTSGNHLAILLGEKSLRVAWPHHAPTNNTHRDTVRSSRFSFITKCAARYNRRRGERNPGGSEKTSARNFRSLERGFHGTKPNDSLRGFEKKI